VPPSLKKRSLFSAEGSKVAICERGMLIIKPTQPSSSSTQEEEKFASDMQPEQASRLKRRCRRKCASFPCCGREVNRTRKKRSFLREEAYLF